MTPTNKCQHDGEMKTGWDELTCKKCFWILPSGQRIGKHFGWFPSHEAHKEFKKYRTYTGMDNTYPIDTTKSAEVQNMTQNNEREAFESWFKTFMPETYSQHVNDEDIEATRQYHSAWLAWQARAQSPISQNEQQAIPDGWKLVPIEPTKAMIEAGRTYFKDTFDDIFQSKTHYKVMLNAAPTNMEVGNE